MDLNNIRHISFDLWGTLIKTNPAFKDARTQYFLDNFNYWRISSWDMIDRIKKVDNDCNYVCEVTGKHMNNIDMYALLLRRLDWPVERLGLQLLEDIVVDINSLVRKHPPLLFSEDTLPTLIKLRVMGKTINITSNTGFIEGRTIHSADELKELFRVFDWCTFSDEVAVSKPNPKMFEEVLHRTQRMYQYSTLSLNRDQILHVGDSLLADVKGASTFGFTPFQINKSDKTIKDLLS